MAVPTPHLRVDLGRLRANVRRVAEHAALARVSLRPHVKTHKSIEIARLQLVSGARGITVATVGEAEAFVRLGCTDVFLAYPVWVDDTRASRLRDLAEVARVAIGVDSVAGAANTGRHLGGTGIEVLVEIDSGHHRTGVAPEQAGLVAQAARRAGLHVRGIFTFPGHGYAPGAGAAVAAAEAHALRTAQAAVEATGLPVHVVSGGSTPTLTDSLSHTRAYRDEGDSTEIEMRPGVYVFGDAQQWELGSCAPADIALTARATVISHAGGRLVLDTGSKVLGADRAAYASGFGRLLHHPKARIVSLSEHHAVVEPAGRRLPRLGTQVDVVPNHVCAAVNLADVLWVEEAGGLRPWPVTARGLNT
ncbi:D-threo-3-hydroxyaspartate dehydratase [Nocardioides dokdonensis FR1436]|uniref:D-threo-3-hydroxyaspartate dehydratase n=1 Tax=Nocardioides dokdonensis FR1436 TaxID=1300347 RepID=A0A1A9GQF7_9ACTN|nr:alanine racemase [Nocardioides dokdonensis]ANH39675.1 D-threo-3-hydroxyaspartate dehydratase [Nocardioides dokdonensis FR1436]